MSLQLSPDAAHINDLMVNLWTRYGSGGEHEERLFIPSEENITSLQGEVRRLQAKADKVRPQNVLDAVTALRVKNLSDVLAFRLADDRAFPFRYLTSLNGSINSLLLMDDRNPQVRLNILLRRLEQAERLLEETHARTATVCAVRRGMTRKYLVSLTEVLHNLEQSLQDSDMPEDIESKEHLLQLAGTVEDKARLFVDCPDSQVQCGDDAAPLPYQERLQRVWGTKLEELLSWHEEEVARSAERYRKIAADIDPGRSPGEILDDELPCCDEPEEMFPLMREFVKRARSESLRYITLPKGETCEVWPVPESLKDSYPWGGYSGPDSLLESLRGAVFLNQHNYRAVTLGWMKMMAIHECYPGHHAQRVKTVSSPLPDCFKLGHLMSRGGPLTEGAAHRSETLLQDIFPDRAFPLFVALRRLHTAVRITADLNLHHFGRPVDEVVSLYQQQLGFSRSAARGQVRFQQLWPGYMTIYYYGQKHLSELQQRLGWDDEAFTELIFSVGYAGLDVLQQIIDVPEDTRREILGQPRFE